MPEPVPPGVAALFLRKVTLENFKVDLTSGSFKLPKETVLKEIQDMGKISDFEPAKKQIEANLNDELLFIIDNEQKYGEQFLLYYSKEKIEEYLNYLQKQEEDRLQQIFEAEEQERLRREAEIALQSIVFEDRPLSPRPWITSSDTELEIKQMQAHPLRDRIVLDVYRPKSQMNKRCDFFFRSAKESRVTEFRSLKDSNFKRVMESDLGIQAAPITKESVGQTTWFQPVNSVVQYEAVSDNNTDVILQEDREELARFLELATTRVELALQQNESVDIFHETFRTLLGDDVLDGSIAENELKETKNFADPTYSKAKALAAIDWVPKRQDMLAVSAVRNLNYDKRSTLSGQSNLSYILLWDFRQLVRPVILMETHSDVFVFRFNPMNPGFVAGGCMSGQVVLWDIGDRLEQNRRRGSTSNKLIKELSGMSEESDDLHGAPRHPVMVSNVDFSHNKAVADLFWFPPNTQINHRGQLVGPEYLDGKCYQFVTVAGDGQLMVWDIRYEDIFNDTLKHIGRTKHVPTEKSSSKDGGGLKPVWAPIFKVHLKRFEGVGEYSLSKCCCSGSLKSSVLAKSSLLGDQRTHIITTTEEGDILFVDLNIHALSNTTKDEEDEDREEASDSVRWSQLDQSRPSVALQQSPFFADIVLTVGDWNFHIWKIGHSVPLFVSPLSDSYLTAGCWSPTRPAVLLVSCADGCVLAWDFTDTSYKPSIPLKATNHRITSMQYLIDDNRSRQQLLAAGDETGTLHIFEIPRVLHRPLHNEEAIMEKFLDREMQRQMNRLDGGIHEGLNRLAALSFSVDNQQAVVNVIAEASAREEARKMAEMAVKREEDEFLKMEQTFITDLGLNEGDLPTWMSGPPTN